MASTPIANVSANGPLTVNGAAIRTEGIASWPVSAGDEVVTTTAPAVIMFNDGTRISVDKHTRVKLSKAGRPGVDVLSGTAIYKTGAASKLEMRALGRSVDLKSRPEGVVSVTGQDKVSVRPKNKGDDEKMPEWKPKKPNPRSPHSEDDQDRGDRN